MNSDLLRMSLLLTLALGAVVASAAEAGATAGDPFAACLAPGKTEETARIEEMQAVIPYQPGLDAGVIESRIAELQIRYGPRGELLFPDLMALGLVHQEQGRPDLAGDAFYRALYIVRANDGLYSPAQIPVLELLIKSRSAAGQWLPAADAWDLLLWTHRRNYARGDPRLLPVLTRLRQWHIEAYNKEDGRILEYHFEMAEKLYKESLQILEQCTGDPMRALCYFHQGCCAEAPDSAYCPADSPYRSASGIQTNR